MAKAFLIGFLTLFFCGIMFLFAFQFNMLSPSTYAYVYELQRKIPLSGFAIPPSLEKYEGSWLVSFTPARAQSELGVCAISSGFVYAHAGVFKGTVGEVGSTLSLNASTTDMGRLTGTMGGNASVRKGRFVADIYNGAGRGTWNDQYECSGTIVLTKQQPVSDPIKGRVLTLVGEATLTREGESRRLLPTTVLYTGDVVQVIDGTVSLGVGEGFATTVNLSPSMAYKVGE